jgi:hypothetical protein
MFKTLLHLRFAILSVFLLAALLGNAHVFAANTASPNGSDTILPCAGSTAYPELGDCQSVMQNACRDVVGGATAEQECTSQTGSFTSDCSGLKNLAYDPLASVYDLCQLSQLTSSPHTCEDLTNTQEAADCLHYQDTGLLSCSEASAASQASCAHALFEQTSDCSAVTDTNTADLCYLEYPATSNCTPTNADSNSTYKYFQVVKGVQVACSSATPTGSSAAAAAASSAAGTGSASTSEGDGTSPTGSTGTSESVGTGAVTPTTSTAACSGGSFLGFPTWYKYLPSTNVNGLCSPSINSLSDIWLIVAAVIEILLRVAALVAVGFVIYGGFSYIISQGEPSKTAQARTTLINALAGLAIAVLAAVVVSFIAGSIN